MDEKSESLQCQFCGRGSEAEHLSGQLHAEDADSGKLISAHHRCMQYASGLVQYKSDEFGGFDINEVEKEIKRGSKLSCHICKASKGKKCKGACCGCAVKACRKTFHFTCAQEDPESITKRLVVTRNRNNDKEKFVLYRVFCSKNHELMFRKTLKEELRGKKNSKRHDSDDENSDPDGSQASTASCNTSAALHNTSDYCLMSPIEHEKKASTSLGQVLVETDFMFATPVTDQTDAGHEESSTNEEEELTTSTPLATKTKSSRRLKERRSSGFLRPKLQRVARRVSQPPSCSLIEEMSNPGVQSTTGEADPSKSGDTSLQHFDAVSETRAASVSTATVVVHVSPAQGSVQNQSPNILRLSPQKRPVLEKSLNECFVSLENSLSVPGNSVHKVGVGSPNKASPSKGHLKQGISESPSPRPEGSPLKAFVASPAKSPQNGLVNGLPSHSASPLKNLQHADENAKDSPARSARSAASPRRPFQLSPRKSPLLTSPHKSTLIVKPSPIKSPQTVALSKQNESHSESPEKSNRSLNGTTEEEAAAEMATSQDSSGDALQSPPSGKESKNSKKNTSPKTQTNGETNGALSRTAMDTGPTPGGDAGGLPSEKNLRKRKAPVTSVVRGVSSPSKMNRRGGDGGESEACVLLIPSDMEIYSNVQDQVLGMAADRFRVKADSVCVWQKVTMQTLPSQLILFFMVDLIKELETDNGETLVNLLFDSSHLTTRLNNYLIQAQIFENLSDKRAQKDVQAAISSGMEKCVENFHVVQVFHLKEQDFTALAVDVRLCQNSQKLMAFLQAYSGLFWWKKDTEVATLPLSPGDHRVATAAEALTLQVWLTKVNPVTEVTIFPHDDLVLDRAKLDDCSDYLTLIQSLKDSTQMAMAAQECQEAAAGGNALRTVVPLLAFKPVDFVVVNFQQYFRKVCHEFFRVRGLMRFLALMPLCNLYCSSYESISTLIGPEYGREDGYSLSVCSAFCPLLQPTTLVLLEIAAHPSVVQNVLDSSLVISDTQNMPATQKKKRGRPKSKKGQGQNLE